jgi:hypothetical protein
MPKTIEELYEQYNRLWLLWEETPKNHPAHNLTKRKCREAFIAWRQALMEKYPDWDRRDYPDYPKFGMNR